LLPRRNWPRSPLIGLAVRLRATPPTGFSRLFQGEAGQGGQQEQGGSAVHVQILSPGCRLVEGRIPAAITSQQPFENFWVGEKNPEFLSSRRIDAGARL